MAEKENKKRMRKSNGVETSNKKVALSGATSGNIKITFQNDDGLPPVLLSSPGLVAPSISFKPYVKPLSARQTNDATPKPHTHSLVLHSSQHARLDYTASPTALDQNLAHYIAIFDPSTKKLRVTPAHHLSLRTKIRSETQDEEGDGKKKRTYAQQRAELGREFGTKKAKKVIAARTVNAISNENDAGYSKDRKADAVQSAILNSMAETSASAGAADLTEHEQLEVDLASKPIPKPNLSAENVEDVYAFNTLIPPADARLTNIKDWQEKTRAGEEIKLPHLFPAARVENIGKSDDMLRLKALYYLTLLLSFHDALPQTNNNRSGKKVPIKDKLLEKLPSYPSPLLDSVRRRFTNTTGSELPKWHLENLYTHICALSLYVDSWTTDVTMLAQDLRMEGREVVRFFKELGCAVGPPTEGERGRWGLGKKVAAGMKVARLRLPLEFPRVRRVRVR